MRIAYVAHVNGGRGSGVISKIASQVEYWRAEGHAVRLFIATTDGDEPWQQSLGDVIVCRYGGPLSRLIAMARLVRAVRDFAPHLIYQRWELFYPPMLWFPGRSALVLEINTDDKAEGALGSRVRATYNALTRWIHLRRARAFVFVTPELSERTGFSRFRAKHRIITNGVDLSAYPVLPVVQAGEPRLVFVGTARQPWHGVDKLIGLAALRPGWRFDIVGIEAEAALPNVAWHGIQERARVIEILAEADVGVGTLALHRKSMNEACPLKVREYLAVGLPVLYGYGDPDADGLGPYALRIANTETNVTEALDAIDAFVTASRGVRVPREAVAHIDVRVKEGQRLALFDELVRT